MTLYKDSAVDQQNGKITPGTFYHLLQ